MLAASSLDQAFHPASLELACRDSVAIACIIKHQLLPCKSQTALPCQPSSYLDHSFPWASLHPSSFDSWGPRGLLVLSTMFTASYLLACRKD
jgi:hypothetical protein